MHRDKGREQASAQQIDSFHYFLAQRAMGTSVYARMARLLLSLDSRTSAPERLRSCARKLRDRGKIDSETYRMYIGNLASMLALHNSQGSRLVACSPEGGWNCIGDGCHHRRTQHPYQKDHP